MSNCKPQPLSYITCIQTKINLVRNNMLMYARKEYFYLFSYFLIIMREISSYYYSGGKECQSPKTILK